MKVDPHLKVFIDSEATSHAAAEHFQQSAIRAVSARGRFLAALSGGSTPQELYRLLARFPYRDRMPWDQMHFFWGDERCVPPTHPESNYGQAKRAFLDQVPVPAVNIHRIQGELEPAAGARDYAHQLQQYASEGLTWPRFDWVLLGLGEDGHTASLFPDTFMPGELELPVIAVTANYQGRPASRVTITPLVFNWARNILFIVSGKNKAETLANVLSSSLDPQRWPVHRINPSQGKVSWLVDRAAASQLPRTIA
jgi:6-phosphogluconolactonase